MGRHQRGGYSTTDTLFCGVPFKIAWPSRSAPPSHAHPLPTPYLDSAPLGSLIFRFRGIGFLQAGSKDEGFRYSPIRKSSIHADISGW
jgi:hypothetical protein